MRYDWFKWYPAMYRADTMHLTAEQDGIYRRLIDHYMETGLPIPANQNAVARIAGVSLDDLAKAWPVILPFFKPDGESLRLKVCDALLTEQEAKHDRMKTIGSRGGRSTKGSSVDIAISVHELEGIVERVAEHTLNPVLEGEVEQNRIEQKEDTDVSSPPMVPQENRDEVQNDDRQTENHSPGIVQTAGGEPAPAAKRNAKGLTLNEWMAESGPKDGRIPGDWIEWVDKKYGWNDATIAHVAERFWRYFTGPDAKEPRKKDWKRAFQAWCDRDIGTAQAFIRANAGASPGQGARYSDKVASSTEQALGMLQAAGGDAEDDGPGFDHEAFE